MFKVRAKKDFYGGLLYVTLAAAFLWLGREYRIGMAARMGPGYFPFVLSLILLGIGLASLIRSFLSEGEPLDGFAWRKLFLVTLAVLIFGFTVTKLGLIIALPLLVLIAASASRETAYDMRGLVVLLALLMFCILVFVKGLGVPMPIFGSVFDDIVPASWQR